MDILPFEEIDASDTIGAQLPVKQEPQNEFFNNSTVDPAPCVMTRDCSFQRIKNELVAEEETIERPCKKTKKQHCENALGKETTGDGENGNPELTQLPCIINIRSGRSSQENPNGIINNQSSTLFVQPNQENHNGTLNASNGIPNNSLQSSVSEWICESDDHVTLCEAVGQSLNNNFTSKVYEILINIQTTLKDLKEEVAENSKKINELHKILPQPSWKKAKSDFNFPISTDEQLLEFETKLENNEMATKLISHLTSRTYASLREMILLCIRYMFSRDVAVLYNLNGKKGTKKKFRDLNICNILVECVQFKFKEATTEEILKRISLTLAGAGSWRGSRHKKK